MWDRRTFLDFFMFYPFFHTCIGGLIFGRSSQTVETSGTLSALQAGSVAFGFLLTSVKTLLATARIGQHKLVRVLAVLPALNAGGRSVAWYSPVCRLLRALLDLSTRLRHHEQDVNKSERVWKCFSSCCLTQTADKAHMYELDHHSLQVVFQLCLVLWFQMVWTRKSVWQRGKSSDWPRMYETKGMLQPVILQTHLLLFTTPAARVKSFCCCTEI